LAGIGIASNVASNLYRKILVGKAWVRKEDEQEDQYWEIVVREVHG
jgi:hypothetical protein